MKHRETTTDPMNSVGKHVMAELEANKVTYKYACAAKRPLHDRIENDTGVMADGRHKKGCIRRYGAVPDPWIHHGNCACHKLPKTDERGWISNV